jgi:DMSO/TMAO reductase YedYZ molybdopterin-dependent catalytic subunit
VALRLVNTAILVLVGVLGATGTYGLFWANGLAFEAHRIAAWGLLALVPWKAGISWQSLKRGLDKRFDRNAMVIISLVLAAATITVLAFGLMWAWRLGPVWLWLHQTTIAWHWILGLAITPVLALHAWRRWPKPRQEDFTSRRGVLKLMAIGAAGIAGWMIAETLAQSRATTETPRRFTGSRGEGLFEGNGFPVTGERTPEIDPAAWRLKISGAVDKRTTLTYDDILAMVAHETTAELDCTLGWYTIQNWQGVRLIDVLAAAGMRPDATGVRLTSVSGYGHVYLSGEVKDILLATHVGGETLTDQHGYPLRAVVPNRRGWFWVKWLERVEVLNDPLEAISGVLASPAMILKQSGLC